MGEFEVPESALYGASTARAVENFPISDLKFSRTFIRSLAEIKKACALVNQKNKLLEKDITTAIAESAQEVIDGKHDDDFVLDIFQTGSGTSTNMNANEVIARLASEKSGSEVHPNDHVNMSQSSNDVIPAATNVAAVLEATEGLIPELKGLVSLLEEKGKDWDKVYKNGRTHLMDATPVTLGQEFMGYAALVNERMQDVDNSLNNVRTGALKSLAVSLFKIANDIRWMGSGPISGLNELKIPALQPGSSIMPGKVNPVIPEMMMQVSAQVIGNDTAITFAAANGNFELNTMLPVMAHNVLESIAILSTSTKVFGEKLIKGLEANTEKLEGNIQKNSILVTALVPKLGYDTAAEVAKEAMSSDRTIKEVLLEKELLSEAEIDELLDIEKLI